MSCSKSTLFLSNAGVGEFAVHILIEFLLIAIVGVLRINAVPADSSGSKALVILQGLTSPHHKDVAQVDFYSRLVLAISVNQFFLTNALEVSHSSNNHLFLLLKYQKILSLIGTAHRSCTFAAPLLAERSAIAVLTGQAQFAAGYAAYKMPVFPGCQL